MSTNLLKEIRNYSAMRDCFTPKERITIRQQFEKSLKKLGDKTETVIDQLNDQ